MNKTINFFKEIAKIPRESGNEEKITEYLCEFARKRNLEYYKDNYNNVLIKKKTSDANPLILQAHTDMVCVSNKDFDFTKESIEVIEKDGYLQANGTTLGADNGIGVAFILTILDCNIPCNIEAVFTSSEETTMRGAENFDTTKLTGKYLLNLDGFDENVIIRASAAYYDLVMDTNFKKEKSSFGNTYKITLSGLPGGHSGYDLDKNRGNAIIMLADFLKQFKLELVSINGGTKNNVFPTKAEVLINTNEDINQISFIDEDKNRYPNLKIEVIKQEYIKDVLPNTSELLDFISNFPSKALYYNKNNEPTTSLNLGNINNNHLEIGMRSTNKDEANKVLEILSNYGNKYNFSLKQVGYQPGFYSSEDSPLIKLLKETDPYKTKAEAKSLHITVEAGFFQERIPELEIAIISPDIKDAHSINERVSIQSISKTYKWLEEFIKAFK